MYVAPNDRNTNIPPAFKDQARNVIYSHFPTQVTNDETQENHLTRSVTQDSVYSSNSFRSTVSSVFSSSSSGSSHGSVYSRESFEGLSPSISIESSDLLVQIEANKNSSVKSILEKSLVRHIQGVNVNDWELNLVRAQLFLTQLPAIYNNKIPIISDYPDTELHVILVPSGISDSSLIQILMNSNLYQEHDLDPKFKRNVAEISVKKARLLQINSKNIRSPLNINSMNNHMPLLLSFKQIALSNYLINLACAATTQYEFKQQKRQLKIQKRKLNNDNKVGLTMEEKRWLWERIRSDVFNRVGLEDDRSF